MYGAPTSEQIDRFWTTVTRALAEPIAGGVFKKNETNHTVELPGTEQRIRAKTCWNADTLRGDYADILILDEWQMMSEDAWAVVGAPMLLDNDGEAYFIYTPPSRRTRSASKARDPMHAAKLFKSANADKSGRWAAFHFTSYDNPHISQAALGEIVQDISGITLRQEILAEDVEDDPNALWKREWIKRVPEPPALREVVVAVDPTGTTDGDECGIVAAGGARIDGKPAVFVLADVSLHASPAQWATRAVSLFERLEANWLIVETNFGGDMVEHTIRSVPGGDKVPIKRVHVTRGKALRAEPIAAAYEDGRGYHVGVFDALEDELCNWLPGDKRSPNRLDALVMGADKLLRMTGGGRGT